MAIKILLARFAHSEKIKVESLYLGNFCKVSNAESIPCRTKTGFGIPVEPLVCRTTRGSHLACSTDLLYGNRVEVTPSKWSTLSIVTASIVRWSRQGFIID